MHKLTEGVISYIIFLVLPKEIILSFKYEKCKSPLVTPSHIM